MCEGRQEDPASSLHQEAIQTVTTHSPASPVSLQCVPELGLSDWLEVQLR